MSRAFAEALWRMAEAQVKVGLGVCRLSEGNYSHIRKCLADSGIDVRGREGKHFMDRGVGEFVGLMLASNGFM